MQEILLAIHLKRQTWISGAPVAPWVFTIARHKVIDFLRRRGRRIHLPLDDFAETLAAESEEPSLIGADIDRHLDSLSTVQRKVVRSIAVDGCLDRRDGGGSLHEPGRGAGGAASWPSGACGKIFRQSVTRT